MDYLNWDFNSEGAVLPQTSPRSWNVWCLISHRMSFYLPWLATSDVTEPVIFPVKNMPYYTN